jgi:hypothetical protein
MSLFRSTLVVTFCAVTLIHGGCAKSEVSKNAAGNQTAPAPGSAESPSAVVQPGRETNSGAAVPTAKGKIDVCALLTSQEIQSIQGEALKETKPSGTAQSGLNISQCFFSLPTFTNSINLAVTQKGDGAGARDPKEFWEERFEKRYENEKEEREREKKGGERDREAKQARGVEREEEEEEGAPPEKIEGVGDEAFWTGSRVGGALYVLKGNAFIRVSVGGIGNRQAQINKSKAIARLALKRL